MEPGGPQDAFHRQGRSLHSRELGPPHALRRRSAHPAGQHATERAIRGPVVGRKNHHGSKSRRGTEVAATLYSLLETAKLHRVDPALYLAEAIRAAGRCEVLLPWHLAGAR